jgi:hypothetical protein
MTMRQLPQQDADEMNERVAGEEESQSQVNRVSAIDVPRRPSERQGYDKEYDAQIANKVWIEWAGMRNGRRKIRVPGVGEEKHPCAISQAQGAGY